MDQEDQSCDPNLVKYLDRTLDFSGFKQSLELLMIFGKAEPNLTVVFPDPWVEWEDRINQSTNEIRGLMDESPIHTPFGESEIGKSLRSPTISEVNIGDVPKRTISGTSINSFLSYKEIIPEEEETLPGKFKRSRETCLVCSSRSRP
jgi:hypothetical protein